MSEPLEFFGKMLLVFGLGIAILGGVLVLMARLGAQGGLPGDIVIRRPGMVVYVPIASAIVASVVLSIILSLLTQLSR